jgi:DHA3 family macrolide efflux protein-like MFS transporter
LQQFVSLRLGDMTAKTTTGQPPRSLAAFVRLELASFVGILGGSMVFMLLPWTAVSLSHSSLSAGLMISLSNIPGLVLSPIMGSLIDRFGRFRSSWLMQMAPILTSVLFPIFFYLGLMNPTTLILIAVARGILGTGAMSARKSLLPDTVHGTKVSLERANSLHESIAAGGFAIGPALASVLIGVMGLFNTFWVVAAVEALAVVITLTIRVVEQKAAEPAEPKHESKLRYILTGFRVLFNVPSVLILMTAFTVLATIYLPTEMVVLPNYYSSVNDARSMGFLLFTMAFFTMLGAFLYDKLALRMSNANIMRFAILGVGLPMIPMAFFPPTPIMFICGALLGFAWGPLPPLVNTVIQRKIPAEQRGRVFSLETTIWTGGPMISMSLVGWGVDALGVRLMYPILAFAVVIAGILLSSGRNVKDLDRLEFVETN